MNAITPIPKVALSIRVATMDDLPFMDELQKKHSKALGYFPRKQFEGYIQMQAVLVAEEGNAQDGNERVGVGVGVGVGSDRPNHTPNHNHSRNHPLLGYIISRDRYLKRDELGVIFQLCVEPGTQRKLVGAALVQAAFERSAYGCRLYSCWCAQDLEANYFWESMGFVPIAFRAGSGKKKRVHIFWQKRIVEDDTETKWWYPFQTSQGAILEDRLVFPIPPGVHWKDVQAVVLPSAECRLPNGQTKALTDRGGKKSSAIRKSQIANAPSQPKLPGVTLRRWGAAPPPEQAPPKEPAARKPRPAAAKIDPKLLRAARELRDRYLERINSGRVLECTNGKYHVSRALPDQSASPKELPCAPLAA